MRKVIVHYHIFKNAGSSVDNILKDSFGDKWLNWDKPSEKKVKILPVELEKFIESNPHLTAISSHHLFPPIPVGDFKVYPIVFLRHPIVRAYSAYLFEWKKQLGLDKPKGSFTEYLEDKLPSKGRSVISNFQAHKLSGVEYTDGANRKSLRDYEILERAKLFLSSIPFYGLVEHFNESLIRMYYYLRPEFPEIQISNYRSNMSQSPVLKLDDNINKIKSEIGEEIYNRLCERNNLDFEIYDYAVKKYFSIVKDV